MDFIDYSIIIAKFLIYVHYFIYKFYINTNSTPKHSLIILCTLYYTKCKIDQSCFAQSH